jgi:flagellin-like protein
MKMRTNKKGISPVIATILLIVVAIGLFVAIFFWIKGMQQESIIKFGSDVKQSCLNLNFDVTYQPGTVQVQNNGNIPIWKAEIYKKAGGSLTNAGIIQGPIMSGTSANLAISCSTGSQIKVTPVLLGTSQKSGTEKEYKCEEKSKIISC